MEGKILRRQDLDEIENLKDVIQFEKEVSEKIEAEYTDETTTTYNKCLTEEIAKAPEKPKPSDGEKTKEEILYEKYMEIPLYNIYEFPKGQSIYHLCKEM